MAKKQPDPLSGLTRSLDAETAAVQKRFNDAERFTTGSPQPRHPSPGRTATMRDTFSFPRDDHRLFAELQRRCFAAGFSASKSELVRAGLHALAAMPGEALAATLGRLEKLKPGPAPREPTDV